MLIDFNGTHPFLLIETVKQAALLVYQGGI